MKKIVTENITWKLNLILSKRQNKVINDDEPIEYRQDSMKIMFESDDNLPLGNSFNVLDLIIFASSVLEKYKYYPQIFLQVIKMMQFEKLIFQKELTLVKHVHQKNVCFVINGTLKMLNLNLNHMFVINIMMYWWLIMS